MRTVRWSAALGLAIITLWLGGSSAAHARQRRMFSYRPHGCPPVYYAVGPSGRVYIYGYFRGWTNNIRPAPSFATKGKKATRTRNSRVRPAGSFSPRSARNRYGRNRSRVRPATRSSPLPPPKFYNEKDYPAPGDPPGFKYGYNP